MRWWLRTACERSERPARYRGKADLRSAWTSVCGLRVHYRAGGTGDAVVLVHGVGVSGRYMVPLAGELASRRAAYVPDLPGSGLSARPPLQPGLAWLAEALVEFCNAIGVDRPAVVANSFGCQIAVTAAVRHPGRFAALVLQGPTVDPEARTVGRQLLSWLANARRERPSQAPLIARDYLDAGAGRVLATFRVGLGDRIEDKLTALTEPVLVVVGEHDRIAPPGWCRQVAELAGGELHVIRAGAHTLNWAMPVEFARAVDGFLGDPRRPT